MVNCPWYFGYFGYISLCGAGRFVKVCCVIDNWFPNASSENEPPSVDQRLRPRKVTASILAKPSTPTKCSTSPLATVNEEVSRFAAIPTRRCWQTGWRPRRVNYVDRLTKLLSCTGIGHE